MGSDLAYEIGATVLIEIDPKNHDMTHDAPLTIAEAIVTSCTLRDDGKTFSVYAKFCEHKREDIACYGTDVPWGAIVHPLTSKGLLVRYQNLRREHDADPEDTGLSLREPVLRALRGAAANAQPLDPPAGARAVKVR